MRQPENAFRLGFLALDCIRYAGRNVGAGVLDSGAQRAFLAVGVHDFAGVATFEGHANLHAEARPVQGCEEYQRDKSRDKDRDNQGNFFQGRTSVKKLPIFRNLL